MEEDIIYDDFYADVRELAEKIEKEQTKTQ